MGRLNRSTIWILATIAVAASAPSSAQESRIDFARDIAPIFQHHCVRCHRPTKREGDLSLSTIDDLVAGELIVPGEPDDSWLLQIVAPAAPGERPEMPKDGDPLSAEQIVRLRQWISDGAKWPGGLVIHETSKADTSWWSLAPLAHAVPPMPPGISTDWTANPIDRFVYAKLLEKGLTPSPPAHKRALIRRATFDLTGLPPTPEEVEAFVSDRSPGAYERLVDRLLQSPHYGERWGRHWLDVVRFGESRGYERNEIINNAWPFRDYVIRSFNEDKPLDRLIMEHLAGDIIGPGDPDVEVGTTFLVCGPYDDVGNQDPVQAAQIRANTIDDVIRATAESFLGITVGCARCHHHKFDPVSQEDYYRLYATFAGVHHGDREVATEARKKEYARRVGPLRTARQERVQQQESLERAIVARAAERERQQGTTLVREPVARTGTEETFAPVMAKHVRLTALGVDTNPRSHTGYRIDEFEVWTAEPTPRNVALSRHGGVAHGKSRSADDFSDAYSAELTIDGRFGACWIAQGPELVVTLAQPTRVNRVVFSSDRTGAAGNQPVAAFVTDYRIAVSRDGTAWQQVASSHDRRPVNAAHRRQRRLDQETTNLERERLDGLRKEIAELDRQIAAIPPLPVWWVGRFEPAPGPFHVFVGGDPQRMGTTVVPASLSFLRDSRVAPYALSPDSPEGQRRLALATWIVSEDNPLTPRVLANRLWHYHFGTGIVDTPSDFGYMGGRPTHPELLDWLARTIHRQGWRLKPLHRLIMLSQTYQQSAAFREEPARADADCRYLWRFPPRRLSGEEVRDGLLFVAGKLNPSMGGPGFRLYRYMQDNVATYVPLDKHGPDTYRRSVYHQNARASRVDLLTDFDCPDNATATPRRAQTTTPLQALTLMNHSFAVDMSDCLAQRLEREAGKDRPPAQVRRAFALTMTRQPTEKEQVASVRLIQSHGLRAFCRALLNSNELIYLD